MCKILYFVSLLLLAFYSCNTQSSRHQEGEEVVPLIDTIIDGDHIRMDLSAHHSNKDIYLRILHKDLIDSLRLESYYEDIDCGGDLLFMNKQRQIIRTRIAKTKNLIIFVMPYYPIVGLYAYTINNNKINLFTASSNIPIYSDYAFYAEYDSDLLASCNQPSVRNTYGGAIWKFNIGKNNFEKMMDVMYDIYLLTDSITFINSLGNIYERNADTQK